jgi:hypothetical protein
MDLKTVMDLFYKSDDRQDACSRWIHNPKCPMVKEKEKARKVWQKVWELPDSKEKEKARDGYFDLPDGEVLQVEYWFRRKDFPEVSKWFAQFHIPFEVLNYELSEQEFMQEEIDCVEGGDEYGKLVEKYENLYKSEPEEKEEE